MGKKVVNFIKMISISVGNKELTERVNSCYDNTCYSKPQIDKMLSGGLWLLNYLQSLSGTEYKIESENIDGTIKIKGFHFNHNDMLIYPEDYFSKKALKDIFDDWKEKKHLSRYTSNGWGTALVVGFDDIRLDSVEDLIKRIKTTNDVVEGTKDNFDEKLKNIKYI